MKVVQLHGGLLGCTMVSETSRMYFVQLPLSKSPLPLFPPITEVSTKTALQDSHFLVVDDAPMCRKVLVKMLKEKKITCDEAEDGDVAILRVKEAMEAGVRYDAILMDYSMPNLIGPEATKRIRKLGFRGKIFGVTGNVLADDIQNFLNSGANKVYLKPVKDLVLEKILRDMGR